MSGGRHESPMGQNKTYARQTYDGMIERNRSHPQILQCIINDATIERACAAWTTSWRSYSPYQREKLKIKMRRALEAFAFGARP